MKIRQGDVLLIEIDKLPANLIEKDKTLAYGEVTGHSHRFENSAVCVFKDAKEQQYVQVEEESTLIHEEHAYAQVPKGIYEVRIQREVDLLGEVRQVLD